MNKNFSRVVVGALLGIALLTVLVILLDKMPLLWAAYVWSVWAVVMFAIGVGFWATGSKIKFVLNAAYPLVLRSYLIASLLIAVIFCGLAYAGVWTIEWGWFCLIEFAILALAAWKLQAMESARDAIVTTEEAVKVASVGWKMLVLEIRAIADRAADRPAVIRAAEAVRYADPMEHPAVESIVETLRDRIADLDKAVTAGDAVRVEELCTTIERLVKKRADALLMLK